jgi:HD-GYP domain-containing protein (c-di-GMP phosphodiesterase class II)
VSNEQAIGVLVLWGSGLQKDDVPVLNVFASQVATAVEKARLYENIQQELVDRKEAEERISKNAARAETLGRLSQVLTESTQTIQAISDLVADYTASLMGGACLITQLSEDGQWLNPIAFSHPEPRAESLIGELLASRPYSVGDGIIGSVVQSGQPVLVSELPQEYFLTTFSPGHTLNLDRYGVFNLYVVPLRAQGGIIGTIGVARDKPIPSYTDDEQELLQEIADRAAMAILNARLYQDAQRRLKHIQALMTVDVAISGSFDLTITLEILLDQVTAQLGVDAANILRFDPQTEMLNFVAGRGFRTRALQHTHSRLGEGYAGTAALERKLVQVPDLRSRHTDFLRSPYFGAEAFVSYYAVPLIAKGQVMGVMELFHRSPLAQDEEWHHFLKAMAGQAAIALDNLSLFNDLQRSNTELIQAYNATIEGWSKALDLRDKETEGHTQRVTSMTVRLAQALGISRSEMAHIRRGALLHDIGKMGVPDRVLLKEGPLTEEEWVVMRNHPVLAHEWLSGIPFLRPALDIPYCHHERWDGTGYPRGLKGEQIPLAARIFAVVDVWDALTSNRPYRKAWTREKTLSHISEQAGSHFEPEVVNAFLMEIANDI